MLLSIATTAPAGNEEHSVTIGIVIIVVFILAAILDRVNLDHV